MGNGTDKKDVLLSFDLRIIIQREAFFTSFSWSHLAGPRAKRLPSHSVRKVGVTSLCKVEIPRIPAQLGSENVQLQKNEKEIKNSESDKFLPLDARIRSLVSCLFLSCCSRV